MAKFTALPRGTQIVLVAGPLLLISLFFTWQNVEVDYGPAGVATVPLDGFDAWGLLLALLVLSVLTLVALRDFSGVEMSEDIAWEKVILGLGAATAAVAVVKSLLDAGSSWASYGFVALAVAVGVGTYLDWAAAKRERRPLLAQKRRGVRPAA
jgi:hypothetical protein